MKMKSFAALAVSSLLATSAIYIAPAMADNEADSQTLQKPGDVGNTPQNNPMPNIGGIAQTDTMNVENNDSNPDASPNPDASSTPDSNPSPDSSLNSDSGSSSTNDSGSTTNPDSNSVTNSPSGSTPPSANDQGAPDTATGDDDY